MLAPVTYQEKVRYFYEDMRLRGLNPWSDSLPPLKKMPAIYGFLWRCGIECRPPIFASFSSLVLIIGGTFGITYGLTNWLLFWHRDRFGLVGAVVVSVVFGTLLGLMYAGRFRARARKLALPAWESYPEDNMAAGR